jgi:hypothetical protein
MTKIYLGNIKGPQGEPGERGLQGNAGPAGAGVRIIATLPDPVDLPDDAAMGDAYVIDGDLWVNGDTGFINIGPFQGDAPQLRESGGWVQWKYPSETTWTNLFGIPSGGASSFGDLTGAPADNANLAAALAGKASTSSVAAKADDSVVVKLTGNQSIDGTKTFSSPPVVPAPTASGHAARKSDVDVKAVRDTVVTDPTNDNPALTIDIRDDNTSTGSWKNRIEILFRAFGASVSNLVTWINEYGEFRGMPAKSNTVGWRVFMAKDATGYTARSSTVPVAEVTDQRDGVRTTIFGVYKGATRINGYLVTIGPVAPSSPEPGQIHILTEV